MSKILIHHWPKSKIKIILVNNIYHYIQINKSFNAFQLGLQVKSHNFMINCSISAFLYFYYFPLSFSCYPCFCGYEFGHHIVPSMQYLIVFRASAGNQGAHSSAIVSYSQFEDRFPRTNGGGKLFTGVLSWFPTAGYTVTLGPRYLSMSLEMVMSSLSCWALVWDQTLCAGISPVQYTQSHGPDLATFWRRFSTVRKGRSHLP